MTGSNQVDMDQMNTVVCMRYSYTLYNIEEIHRTDMMQLMSILWYGMLNMIIAVLKCTSIIMYIVAVYTLRSLYMYTHIDSTCTSSFTVHTGM